MKILVLDRSMSRRDMYLNGIDATSHDVFICKDTMTALSCLKELQPWDVLLLGGQSCPLIVTSIRPSPDALAITQFLVRYRPRVKTIIIHSIPRKDADSMATVLRAAGYDVKYTTFARAALDLIAEA